MNSKTVNRRGNSIELPSSKDENAQPSKLVSRWNQVWQSLSHHLMKDNEPQVWQRRDRYGNVWWVAYDPASGRSLLCSTEQEVRIWLEQTRYR
ncbi:hypothetical protein [Leptolyngbya ohadii]|uniref:hypothetical protein n=1 Tax=Leptolyngbya ohadii TaxID=1962290 RepID=UPI00117A3667|nr:hypothetical protein [Leptolyngbya ohadii]